ncbi:Citrate transporter [compost metagenome]
MRWHWAHAVTRAWNRSCAKGWNACRWPSKTLLIFAAGIFVGIMSGTGMIKAISESLIHVIPESAGHFMSVITAFLSMPFTYVLTNDAFYFGILPILAETASHYGIGAKEMAIAGLIGQPVHLLSPLVASTYLLCGLLDLDYGDNQRASIRWSIGNRWQAAIRGRKPHKTLGESLI